MDKYAIVSLIGEGSFGRVYKANRKSDNNVVAIKIITKRGKSSKEVGSLRRECEIQGNLKHPNIIAMFDSFETKNEIFVVTEFAATDLHRFLSKNGAINEEKAQNLTVHLVSALYYLHSHRILHRDLKPQNVLLDDEFHAKLCDFGLARNMTMGTHVLTSIKGTPLYMAPELLSEKPYDHQADLWSLGCIIYESLLGHPPFCTTSILHLVRLIRHEEVKWPSFLSSDCISFLQGLLEKDSSLRMTWTQILCHPFVEGRLEILNDCLETSPFISSSPKNHNSLKFKDKEKGLQEVTKTIQDLHVSVNTDLTDNVTSSKDSVNAMLQSDIENIETDAEDTKINVPFSDNVCHLTSKLEDLPYLVSGNANLVVNHFNDNFVNVQESSEPKDKSKLNLNLKKSTSLNQGEKNSRNKDLEKRKLSQNLDNFSLRLGQTIEGELTKKHAESISEKKKSVKTSTGDDKIYQDNTPPCLLPGWDSCDESQSPPIENEEWLAFLHRSMQEILDGELDSLKQQNLVSIIVAPLRNTKASSKVVESVAQLLSLPLVLGGPPSVLECIKNVYVEVKLVPNLVYASKLLTSTKCSVDSTSSLSPLSVVRSFKFLSDLSTEQIKTISSLYELVCHLVHLNERFLSQFCDAVAILSADELLINFLSHDFRNTYSVRISNCVIALLCCVVRELPENAELVEKIVFNQQLDLVALMKNKDSLLRARICMLLRLLGRFSCRGLQSIWTPYIRETMEALMYDSNEHVRMEAECALGELKQFSFYN